VRGARNKRLASTLKRLGVAGACSKSRYDGELGDSGWTQEKALKLSAS